MIGLRSYRVLVRILAGIARLYLKKRAKKNPAYALHWSERFGKGPYPQLPGPVLWIHVVSLGETLAARPLMDAWLEAHPESSLLLTHMTPTGREAGAKIVARYPNRVAQCYLPYDVPVWINHFLEVTRPDMGILMETEVWPNVILEARARGIPMILANARESEKSQKQAQRFIRIMQPAFSALNAVLAQSQEDAQRIKSLGAHSVTVCGSMKFDVQPNHELVERAHTIKQQCTRPIVLLASTRDGEEAELMTAWLKAEVRPNAIVLIVPRHPERFSVVKDWLNQQGIQYQSRSMLETDQAWGKADVIVGDSLGEMSLYCALADVCVMGGSFGPYGCQNLIEPASLGVPVIVGTSTFNFAKVVSDAVKMGAAVQVENSQMVWAQVQRLLTKDVWEIHHKNARKFAQTYTGATARHMNILEQLWKQERSRMS